MRRAFLPRIFVVASISAVVLLVLILRTTDDVKQIYLFNKEASDVQASSINDARSADESDINNVKNVISAVDKKPKANAPLKYILQYTSPRGVPFVYMGLGQEGFISNGCAYTNCFVTGNKEYFDDITKFDALAFNGPEVVNWPKSILPTRRAPHQKYIFGTIESSHYYPVCSDKFDGFFNWTWTFRLDSQVRWGYMDVRDAKGNLIGPNKIMHWMKVEDMDPVSEEFKEKIKTKKIAAAWFVTNCYDKSGRLRFAKDLQEELKKYNLVLDIYGGCGPKKCPRDTHDECMKMVDKSYYFYMSFENSFSEDYVTEKLLMALQVDVLPVVYGGANYTRFMPDGIYLNARELGPAKLAAKMDELIKNPEEYANYFKWKKYYSYHGKHERPETNEYCQMCEILNNEEEVKKTTIVKNFREWWDSPKQC